MEQLAAAEAGNAPRLDADNLGVQSGSFVKLTGKRMLEFCQVRRIWCGARKCREVLSGTTQVSGRFGWALIVFHIGAILCCKCAADRKEGEVDS